MSNLKKFLLPVVRSYSAVFFNSNLWGGIVLLLLTFLINFNLGIGGLISVFSSYVFARVIGFKREFLRLDYYIYNPLLVGLSLGYLFKVNLLSVFFLAIAGILTFLLTYVMSSVLSYYFRLPVLSVPFVVVSSLFYLASMKFSNLFVGSLYYHDRFPVLNVPLWLKGYLQSLGAVFFMPEVIAGIVISVVLFLVSRILFFLSLLGYFSGVLVEALLKGSYYQAFSDTSAFNFILVSMAVGGVFLIPSLRSYKFAVLSSIISVPVVEGIKVFWESYGIPVFALPFNLVTHVVLYVLISVSFYYVTRVYKGTPERTLDYFLTSQKRFPFTGREIHLPFSGKWTVWQSFDGEWTHKGAWKYAVDFVVTDENGNTFAGDGYNLTDYYAFGKPVLSPIDGQVVAVVNDVPDNPPGSADKERNWGNYVILYDKRGFYVLIAHFKQGSIKVKVGDFVARGAFLGLCGNSGYSPQPHIHIHVQLLPEPGVPTVPFKFSSYTSGNLFYDVGIPVKGEVVEPVYPDKGLQNRLNFLIDQEFFYELEGDGKVKEIHLKVKMAPDGTFYFTDGRAKLYFGISNSTFYFYHLEGDLNSPLRYFLFCASKVPLAFKEGLKWTDYLPLLSVGSALKRSILLFISSFAHSFFEVRVNSEFVSSDNKLKIISQIKGLGSVKKACAVMSDALGFDELNFDDKIIIRRKEDEKTTV